MACTQITMHRFVAALDLVHCEAKQWIVGRHSEGRATIARRFDGGD